MIAYWCDNCKVPILHSNDIKSEKSELNPYIDIEDEVVEWMAENNYNEEFYNEFMTMKRKVYPIIDKFRIRMKKEKSTKNKVLTFEKALEETKEKNYELEITEDSKIEGFVFRYVKLKLSNYLKKGSEEFLSEEINFAERKRKNIKCPNCKDEAEYMSKDIRPVFMEERIMLSVLLEEDFTDKNIWNGKGNRYIIDGASSDIAINEIYDVNNLEAKKEEIRERIKENEKRVDFSLFKQVNSKHFKYIDAKAIKFVENASELFSDRQEVVSFSGGKDSTVISDLVRRGLNRNDILHIFGDTTLEFPYTYQYVEALKNKPSRPPFLPVDTPNQSFYKLAEKFGPPSRVMTWCCSIFKTGPIGNLFKAITEEEKILTYYGIRRSESSARSGYDKITKSPKITKQLVISPIIDWKDAEIWLYLLTRGIDFNKAYRLGFTRVGCWCCPNNSKWSEFLCGIFMPERSESWRNFLVDFAKEIGKPDAEVYIDTGKWKARQGGQGLDVNNDLLDASPCGLGEEAKEYELTREIDDSLYELFKPFGIIDKEIGNQMLGEVYILDRKTNVPRIKLQGIKGSNKLKVVIPDKTEKKEIKRIKQNKEDDEGQDNKMLLFQRIECQLRKYQICESCSACSNICPRDAINTKGDYKIDETKCIGDKNCGKCIAYFHKGCLITKTTADY